MGKSDHHSAAAPTPGADDTAGSAVGRLPKGSDGVVHAASLDSADRRAILTSLTDKQRAVLDLLIEHKTSKEISRIRGISHHTVDQPIMLARAKLGVAPPGPVAPGLRRPTAVSGTGTALQAPCVHLC